MRKVRREVTRKLILAAVIGEPNAVSNAIGYAMVESRQSRTNRGPTQKIRRYARLIPLGLPTIGAWRWQRALHDRDDSPASAVIAALCECSRATSSFTRAAGSPPEREALEALITETQRDVIGLVRLKLYKGNIIVVARKSLKSLYDPKSPPWRAAHQLTTKATLLDLLG